MEEIKKETSLEKEPIIGKYKPKLKFLNFISGLKGGVRIIDKTAYLKSENLSGMIDGVIFKVTICDEGTINFEETDTSKCDEKMISRFIDDICERDVIGYMSKFVIFGVDFQDADAKKCYLEVEHTKPIDKLFSLISGEDENAKKMEINLSDNGLSILDSLFSEEDLKESVKEETKEEIIEEKSEEKTEEISHSQQMMKEAFERMNAEKVQELKERIENSNKEFVKTQKDIKLGEKKISELKGSIKVLESRLESLSPIEDKNGYVFFVSEEKTTGIEPDQALIDVVDKISPYLHLNSEVVIKMLTTGYFTIKIAPENDIKFEITESISKDIIDKVLSIDIAGTFKPISKNEVEYRGELNWHQLVGKMIRKGFSQDETFDRECGSNSYQNEVIVETDGNKDKNINENNSEDMGNISKFNDFKDDFEDDDSKYLNDEFLFAVMVNDGNEQLFFPKNDICITPKSYWDEESCQYDNHIGDILSQKYQCGMELDEVQEGCFVLWKDINADKYANTDEIVDYLCKKGVKFNEEFQDFISAKDTSVILQSINTQGYTNNII